MALSTNVQGALFMATAMAAFAVGDTMSKILVHEMNVGQIIFIRGLAMTLFMTLLAWRLKALRHPRLLMDRMLLLRVCLEALATATYVTALGLVPFATVSAMQQAIPLVVTLGAALFFHEPVGWRRWTAIVVGLAGVLVILRPDGHGLAAGALIAIGSMFFTAARDLSTRAISREIPSLMISLCTSGFITVVGAVLIPALGGWKPVAAIDGLHLAIGALGAAAGYQAAILGMRTGDVSFVSPMRYLGLIFSAASGFLVFGEIPDRWTFAGAGIVIAAGIYAFYREARRKRHPATPPLAGPRIVR